MDPIPVAHLDDPRLAPYRSLRARSGAGEEIAVADGIRVVATLLSLRVPLASIVAPEEELAALGGLLAAHGVDPPVLVLPRAALSAVIGYRYHGGVMAAVETLPTAASLEELGERVVVLGELDKGENIGAIARTALAFGATGLLLSAAGAGPWQRSAIRASRGTVFGLRVRRSADPATDLRALRARGVARIGTAARGGAPLASLGARAARPWALLLGSEGHGLPDELRDEVDVAVTIPIAAPVESLNVAAAAAVLLHALASGVR